MSSLPKISPGLHYGKLEKNIRLKNITISETQYSKQVQQPKHYHENPYITVVTSGVLEDHYGSSILYCPTKTLIFHPSNTEHYSTFLSPITSCLIIEFEKKWFTEILPDHTCLTKVGRYIDWTVCKSLVKLKNLSASDLFSNMIAEGLSMQILAELVKSDREYRAKPSWLPIVLDFIHQEKDEKLVLAELAALCNCSQGHMLRSFKKYMGCTITEYILNMRIEKAKQKLISTSNPISSIALECGFYDVSHFSRVFKSVIGTSPSALRKNKNII